MYNLNDPDVIIWTKYIEKHYNTYRVVCLHRIDKVKIEIYNIFYVSCDDYDIIYITFLYYIYTYYKPI